MPVLAAAHRSADCWRQTHTVPHISSLLSGAPQPGHWTSSPGPAAGEGFKKPDAGYLSHPTPDPSQSAEKLPRPHFLVEGVSRSGVGRAGRMREIVAAIFGRQCGPASRHGGNRSASSCSFNIIGFRFPSRAGFAKVSCANLCPCGLQQRGAGFEATGVFLTVGRGCRS